MKNIDLGMFSIFQCPEGRIRGLVRIISTFYRCSGNTEGLAQLEKCFPQLQEADIIGLAEQIMEDSSIWQQLPNLTPPYFGHIVQKERFRDLLKLSKDSLNSRDSSVHSHN